MSSEERILGPISPPGSLSWPTGPEKALDASKCPPSILASCKAYRSIGSYLVGTLEVTMSSEIMHRICEMIEAEVRSRPSAIEFEMAYQARVAIDRIRFAIKHTELFANPCIHLREANMQLLDALDRLESLDRRFQNRSRIAADRNGPTPGVPGKD